MKFYNISFAIVLTFVFQAIHLTWFPEKYIEHLLETILAFAIAIYLEQK